MKNILSKSYITLFFLLACFITFAQPGTGDGSGGGLEGTDPPATPINDYIFPMLIVGIYIGFHFLKGKIKEA